jgi:hypothetical protein
LSMKSREDVTLLKSCAPTFCSSDKMLQKMLWLSLMSKN